MELHGEGRSDEWLALILMLPSNRGRLCSDWMRAWKGGVRTKTDLTLMFTLRLKKYTNCWSQKRTVWKWSYSSSTGSLFIYLLYCALNGRSLKGQGSSSCLSLCEAVRVTWMCYLLTPVLVRLTCRWRYSAACPEEICPELHWRQTHSETELCICEIFNTVKLIWAHLKHPIILHTL